MFEATEITHQNSDWITFVLLFVLVVLSLLRVIFKNRLLYLNTLFISKRYFLTYFNKGKINFFDGFQLPFFIVQLLVLSLLIYLVNRQFQLQLTPLNFRGYIFTVFWIGLYFILHYLIGLLLAFLFNFKINYSKIVYHKNSYFNNLILWLLPFIILTVYINNYQGLVLNITLLLFGFLLLLRYNLILINNKKLIFNNLFYFILYLCALEIAPLIIVLKLTF